jgi:oligoribonuclease
MHAIFLDMETTGLDSKRHFAIDVAFRIIEIQSWSAKASYQSVIKQPKEAWDCQDPMSIQINGYSWEKVQSGKDPALVGQEIISIFTELGIERGKAVFICQNPAFDRAFFSQLIDVYTQEKLNWPYHWLDLASMYWAVLTLKCRSQNTPFPAKINLSKNSIAQEYSIPAEIEPHVALNGVEHLIKCYQEVLCRA